MAKGVGLRLLSRRGSWVQIPPSALLQRFRIHCQFLLGFEKPRTTERAWLDAIGEKEFAQASQELMNMKEKLRDKSLQIINKQRLIVVI